MYITSRKEIQQCTFKVGELSPKNQNRHSNRDHPHSLMIQKHSYALTLNATFKLVVASRKRTGQWVQLDNGRDPDHGEL